MILLNGLLVAIPAASLAAEAPPEQVVPQLGHTNEIVRLAWAPDGTWAVSTGRDGVAKLWTSDGRLLRTLGAGTLMPQVAIAPTGGNLLLGGHASGLNQSPECRASDAHRG